jgi:hypothetical protein
MNISGLLVEGNNRIKLFSGFNINHNIKEEENENAFFSNYNVDIF